MRTTWTPGGPALLGVVFLGVAGNAANAAIVVLTDEADFIAAVGAHDLETFEGTPVGDYGTADTFGNLFFDSSPSSQIMIRDTPGQFGAHNTTPGGERFLHADSLVGSFHDPMLMGRTDGPMLAYGANFTDLDFGEIDFFVDGVLMHSPIPGGDGNTMFVGFLATDGDSFSEVRLEVNDRTYGIDDVRSLIPAQDSDGDGIPDDEDACPDSDLGPTIVIDGCDSGVENILFEDGCTMSDLIAECADGAANHGAFVSCVAHLTNEWKRAGLISGQEEGAIQSCAAQADIPGAVGGNQSLSAGSACPPDLDDDGSVGTTDLLALLAAWGTDPGGPPDFDGDGHVGTSDLLELLANWGPCPK